MFYLRRNFFLGGGGGGGGSSGEIGHSPRHWTTRLAGGEGGRGGGGGFSCNIRGGSLKVCLCVYMYVMYFYMSTYIRTPFYRSRECSGTE